MVGGDVGGDLFGLDTVLNTGGVFEVAVTRMNDYSNMRLVIFIPSSYLRRVIYNTKHPHKLDRLPNPYERSYEK